MTKARDLANASTALSAVSATELAFVDGVTSAIQTQMDAKAPSSTAVTLTGTQTLTNKTLTSPALTTPTISTATTNGDILYGTGSGALARLGIGTTGQVLNVAGGVPAWATATAAGTSWTLLNTGGTALTGATTITITGISSKDKIMIVVPLASSVNNNVPFQLRLNSDSGTNYYAFGNRFNATSTYSAAVLAGYRHNAEDHFQLGTSQNGDAYAYIAGTFFIDGGASSGIKSVQYTGGGVNIGYNSQESYSYGGYYNSSSTISSVSIISTSGNFDLGTIFVYTSN